MRVLFFGTPLFAASILKTLFDAKVEIDAVVTQPDRPQKRSSEPVFSKVKEQVLESAPAMKIFQPEKCSDPSFIEEIRKREIDLFIVVAFGQILPQKLLDLAKKGAINVHASLLPKYRGAAPIQRAILNGEEETGISIQKMVLQMDAGDVIASAKMKILPHMNYGELQEALCELAKELLLMVLQNLDEALRNGLPQNPTLVTFAPKVLPEEAKIDWSFSAKEVLQKILAFSPKPGAWCWMMMGQEKKRVKIFDAEVVNHKLEIAQFDLKELLIGCGEKSLRILKIQTEGKKMLSGAEWFRGFSSLPEII